MEITTNCPGCRAKVRVPDTLLGRSVKCPKCQTVFTAENPDDDPGYEEIGDDDAAPVGLGTVDVPARQDADYERRTPRDRAPSRMASKGRNAVIIRSIGVLSVGGIMGSIYAILGLIIGALMTILSLLGAAVGGRNGGPEAVLFGVCSIVFIPVFYGAIGFVAGIIMAALYNVMANIIGGIRLELDSTG
jgi:predicted Zn finger-like uncharacterized protein